MAFALKRNGAGSRLAVWMKFWVIATVVKVIEILLPMRLLYYVAKYAFIMFVASKMTIRLVSVFSSHQVYGGV